MWNIFDLCSRTLIRFILLFLLLKRLKYFFFNFSSFRYRQRSEKRRDSSNAVQTSFAEKRQAVAPIPIVETRHTAVNQPTAPTQPNVTYNLGHIGAGPAIAAAASQAIAATQQVLFHVLVLMMVRCFTRWHLAAYMYIHCEKEVHQNHQRMIITCN